MKIEQHRLKDDSVEFQESPNHGGKLEAGEPDSIIIHYTAGGSLDGAVRTLTNPARKASAHLVIGRDGSITQLVPFDTVAWHAGKSSYDGRSGFNKYSVGIELDNAGRLTKSEGGYTSWFGRTYPGEEVLHATHRNESQPAYWHTFTEMQINLTFDLCELLIGAYPIESIMGHEEISPTRKSDPGPAFPLDKLRTRLLVRDRVDEGPDDAAPTSGKVGMVTASRLNIRSAPGLGAERAGPPLPRGTMLDILEESDGWLKVDVRSRGWVSREYVAL